MRSSLFRIALRLPINKALQPLFSLVDRSKTKTRLIFAINITWQWCSRALGILNIEHCFVFLVKDCGMVITIKKGDSKKTIEKKLSKLPKKKGFQAYKYLGKIKFDEDPVAIQRRLRDEWKKRSDRY